MASESSNPASQTTIEAPASAIGLRARADMIEGKLNDSGSCAAHLRSAAARIEWLRSLLQDVVDDMTFNVAPNAGTMAKIREALHDDG